MAVKKPWHWDASATILPLSLPILLAVPALVFGWVQRRWKPGRNLGYLLAFAGPAAMLGVYLELQYTRRITWRKEPLSHSLAGGCC